MTFEEWAKSKGHPFHDLEPTFNGSKDRYSEIAREAWEAGALAERDACAAREDAQNAAERLSVAARTE